MKKRYFVLTIVLFINTSQLYAQDVNNLEYVYSNVSFEHDELSNNIVFNVKPDSNLNYFAIKKICYSLYSSEDNYIQRIPLSKGVFSKQRDDYDESLSMYCYDYVDERHLVKLSKYWLERGNNINSLFLNYLVVADYYSTQIVLNKKFSLKLRQR